MLPPGGGGSVDSCRHCSALNGSHGELEAPRLEPTAQRASFRLPLTYGVGVPGVVSDAVPGWRYICILLANSSTLIE